MIDIAHDIWQASFGYAWEVSVYDRTPQGTTLFYSSGHANTKIGAKVAVWREVQQWKRVIRKAAQEVTR